MGVRTSSDGNLRVSAHVYSSDGKTTQVEVHGTSDPSLDVKNVNTLKHTSVTLSSKLNTLEPVVAHNGELCVPDPAVHVARATKSVRKCMKDVRKCER